MGLVGHLSAAAVVRVAALLLFLAAIVGCNSSAAPADPITIRLHTPEGESAGIEVVNVPASVMRSLETRELTREEWAQGWFFDFCDRRIELGLPLIITTNLGAKEIAASSGHLRGDPLLRRLLELC